MSEQRILQVVLYQSVLKLTCRSRHIPWVRTYYQISCRRSTSPRAYRWPAEDKEDAENKKKRNQNKMYQYVNKQVEATTCCATIHKASSNSKQEAKVHDASTKSPERMRKIVCQHGPHLRFDFVIPSLFERDDSLVSSTPGHLPLASILLLK